jgi:hypothetical protein
MFRSGAEHVRQPSLEPGLGTGYAGPCDLTWVKTEGPDKFGITLWNQDKEPDKANWDLATEELRLD